MPNPAFNRLTLGPQVKAIIFLLVAGSCTMPYATAQEMPIRSYSQKQLFKNWVLSHCLAKATPVDASRQDAESSAGAYLEFGTAPVEAYEKADQLTGQYLSRKYDGSIPGEFNTMKCIDLYHSNDVELLAKKYAKKK